MKTTINGIELQGKPCTYPLNKGLKTTSCNSLKYLLLLALFFIFTLSKPTFARPIISGISSNTINIDTKFIGTEILLFGVQGDAGNIVVTIRGPKKDYLINKKSRFLGVWFNRKRVKFSEAYSYYSLFSNQINSQISEKLLQELELGEENIKFNISGNIKDDAERKKFQNEFISKLESKELYRQNPYPIDFLDESLFKIMLNFPKNISPGTYIVEIYLIDEANLVAFQTIPIYVNQVGISARIHQIAYEHSFLYGIIAVLLAVIAGFLANYIFSRFIK